MVDRDCLSEESSVNQPATDRKWCSCCNCWFTPRPCNAKRQCHCCQTPACRLASKRNSNRRYRQKMSACPAWRRANVLRVQHYRRILRDGFDSESVVAAVEDLFDSLSELLNQVSTALHLLESYRLLQLPAVLLQKLPGYPVTVAIDLELAHKRTAYRSEKAILCLRTIPSLPLRDHFLVRCA